MTTPTNHKNEFATDVLAKVSQEHHLTGSQVRLIARAYGKLPDVGIDHLWAQDAESREAWCLQQLPGQPLPAGAAEAFATMEKDFSTQSHNGPPPAYVSSEVHDALDKLHQQGVISEPEYNIDMQAWLGANPGKMWPPEDVEAKLAAHADLSAAVQAVREEIAQASDTEPIRHTKHAQGCFQAAANDEPVFTLRAKDAFAPALVLQWAMLVEQSHLFGATGGEITMEEWEHMRDKVGDARHCARAMVEWQRNNTHKIPD